MLALGGQDIGLGQSSQRFNASIALLFSPRLTSTHELERTLGVPDLAVERTQIYRQRHLAGLMAKGFRLLLCPQQEIASGLDLALKNMKISERSHHERQKDADLTLA